MKKCLSLLLTAFLLAGCGPVGAVTAPTSAITAAPTETAVPTEVSYQLIPEPQACIMDEYRIYYEIFPRSYSDSDGDGLGDLKGIQEKLSYLQDELGAGGLWLMPIHPSPSYHKYDVLDYYAIDPQYGTLEDFESLSRECDNRGMHIILDLVLNHTSDRHPWFQEACTCLAALPDGTQPDPSACPYVDYYHFLEAEACPNGYHPVPGSKRFFYEGRFTPQMPDLNLNSEALRREIRSIMDFWFQKGVDGFRLDAVKEYESGKTDESIALLRWIQETARELKPGCILAGEAWDSFHQVGRYYESGIPSLFNFPFAGPDGKIIKVLRSAGNPSMVTTFATALQKADGYYRSQNPDYVDAPFLSNHDLGRIAGFVGRDPNKVKLAGAMNLFMSGSAFLYYGEEIGMVSGAIDDPSYRAPMVWEEGKQAVEAPPGCTLPDTYPFGSLAQQQKDPLSIYNYYRAAAAIRNALPVLSHGTPEAETALNQGCVSAVRKTYYEQTCILLMNIDENPAEVDLSGYGDFTLMASLTTSDTPVTMAGEKLLLPPWGTAVLLKEG